MARENALWQPLTEKDIDFLVGQAVPESGNKERMKLCIKEDPTFRERLIGDKKVLDSVRKKTSLSPNISPQLYFEILLRGAIREMEENTHTVERSATQRIPVFDLKETIEFMQEEYAVNYLAHLLSSFVATGKETPKDIDIDFLLSLGKNAEDQTRYLIYKRIADICLFILGIFPKHVMYDYYYLFFKKPLPIAVGPRRSLSEYEWLGREFYRLASKEKAAKAENLDELLQTFSEKFNLAKKPLNFLSEHYLALV